MTALEANIANAVFVMPEIALMGQHTVLFAEPNTGKTLITQALIIEAIKKGDVDASKIFYVNADDNSAGIHTKTEIANQYGFNVIAIGATSVDGTDMTPDSVLAIMDALAAADEAKDVVFVFDTVKKFTDVMDKSASSRFGVRVRAFTAKGGTVISLAHTNKNKDGNGKAVMGGTSDLRDDCDAAYIMQIAEESTPTNRIVLFDNKKVRGNNTLEVSYNYAKHIGDDYIDLLQSVAKVTDAVALQAHNNALVQAVEAKYPTLIPELDKVITVDVIQSVVLKTVSGATGLSEKVVRTQLDKLVDIKYKRTKVQGKNAFQFTKL